MGGIFLSYRDDTAHSAGRLANLLGAHFGAEQVLMVDSIRAGADAAAATIEAVRHCEVLIVLIGPSWLMRTDDGGRRRIDREDDLVAAGIATALKRGVMLLPVLVDGAEMPRAADLPEKVRGLARRRAVPLDHMTFRSDATQLIDLVESALPEAMRPRRRSQRRRQGLARSVAVHPQVDRPVPLSRAIRRIALWCAVFLFANPTSVSIFSLIIHSDDKLIVAAITIALSQAILLAVCVVALGREIRAQRRMIAHAPDVDGKPAMAVYRAVSNGRIWTISLICIVEAILVGVSVATAPTAARADSAVDRAGGRGLEEPGMASGQVDHAWGIHLPESLRR